MEHLNISKLEKIKQYSFEIIYIYIFFANLYVYICIYFSSIIRQLFLFFILRFILYYFYYISITIFSYI